MATTADFEVEGQAVPNAITGAAYYALGVLILSNFLNYVDRQILSILAEAIKHDLGVDDAQIGFLLGTAFAIFYSVVGIAMGGVADRLSRKRVMAAGLTLWSAMTMVGGMANTFFVLSLARIGVGVGEATSSPCSHSLIADIFPARRRATAMGVWLVGTFIGIASSTLIGGYFLQHWSSGMCRAVPIAGACSLAAWKAALLAVGLPGLPLALLLLGIREPERPRSARGATGVVLGEIAASLPPVTLLTVFRLGGTPALVRNLMIAAFIGAVSALLATLTGDAMQWGAFGIGVYAIASWGQVQGYRDRPLVALTLRDRTFMYCVFGVAPIGCLTGTVTFWAAPYAIRTFKLSSVEIGGWIGTCFLLGAIIGVIAGGWLTDRWKVSDRRAPLAMAAISMILSLPTIVVMMLTSDFEVFIAGYFVISIVSALFSGAITAMVQDIMLPRMRGSGAACYSLIVNLITFGIGPYWAGKVSALTGSLSAGLFSMLGLVPLSLAFLWLASRRIALTTPETRLAQARAAGEPA